MRRLRLALHEDLRGHTLDQRQILAALAILFVFGFTLAAVEALLSFLGLPSLIGTLLDAVDTARRNTFQ